MTSLALRFSVLGAVPAALAGAAVVAFVGLNGVPSQPISASANTVVQAAGMRLADDQDTESDNELLQQDEQLAQDAQTEEDNLEMQTEEEDDTPPVPDFNLGQSTLIEDNNDND